MSENINGGSVPAISRKSPLVALGDRFSIEPAKLVEVLRGTVIKPTKDGRQATNEEIAAFVMVANQYALNPFTREIHAFADPQKGVVPIVGVDGWCRIVNDQPGFNGCEFVEVGDDKGVPVSITCKMHVKGREHPVCVTERFAECRRNSIPWQTMPWRMLRHKAFMQAARYAFSLSGIYDEDEARDIVRAPVDERPPIAEPLPLGEAKTKKKAKAEPAPEPDILEPSAAQEPPHDPELERAVQDLEIVSDGFPKLFAKAAGKIGVDPSEWLTAPREAILKLARDVQAEIDRQ